MKVLPGIDNSLTSIVLEGLERLMDKQPIAFYELWEVCRDPNHALFGNTEETLKKQGFLEGNGLPHKAVCEIVEAHTEGEGLGLALTS